MRLSVAEVLDWLHAQHTANANEGKRRAKLQQVLNAVGEPHSADDLPGIAAYQVLRWHPEASPEAVKAKVAGAKRLYRVQLTLAAAIAASIEDERVKLSGTQEQLKLDKGTDKTGRRKITMYFGSVEPAVRSRDEALFAIYGLCAACCLVTSLLLLPL